MNDQKGQREEMFTDKNVTACNLPETIVCNNKKLTYNIVKDICVDEGVPKPHEMFLFNEKDSVNIKPNLLDSKSLEDINLKEVVDAKDSAKVYQANLIVNGEKVKDDSKVCCEKVVAKTDNLRYRLSAEKAEVKKPLLVVEDSYDPHHLLFSRNFPNGFGNRSFSEAELGLAHITYSGRISVGNLSARSDASTNSARSFAFPILQSEWNSSPIRMAKAEKRQRQLREKKGWRYYSHLLCCRF